MESGYHIPVMLEEVINYLNLKPGMTIVDATLGTGGHSKAILERISPGGRLIGLDRDKSSIEIARNRLKEFEDSCTFVHSSFIDLDTVLKNIGIKEIDGIVFDLGISTYQLSDPARGFSFQSDTPLDMRMDKDSYISAYDLINSLNEDEISDLLWTFGEERWHKRIARLIVEAREKQPIATTKELADLVMRSIPLRYRHQHYRIHPATRTFQAVRIAVNREIEIISDAINKAIEFLGKRDRICVISFHSLEDRQVKLTLRKASEDGLVQILTKKPLIPGLAEIQANPSSRSSKLRVAERI